MGKVIDHTGQKFGRLTVIGLDESNPGRGARWKCACRCGNETVALGSNLRQGRTRSCGCLLAERQKAFTRSLYPLGKVEPMPALEDLDDLVKW